jgi:iron complex outermembrane receptor protein
MSIKEFHSGYYVAVAVSLALAMPAFTQTPVTGAAADDQGEGLSEVVVTARRIEERSQDVPISIQVFNQEQLTQHNVVNAADLALYTPSLSANPNFGSANSSFAIRGFVQDSGTAPSVATYFADVVAARGNGNGIPVGDGAGPGYFYDMQNVQVLKGPQGTLFGRNTTGGAVLFVPQKPTSEFGGYVEASYGNYDMRRVEAAINLPLNDSLRFRLALDDQRRDGYLNNYTGIGPDNFADVNYTALRASLVADITANLENYTILSFSRSDTNGDVQKVVGCDAPIAPTGGFACAQLAAEKAFGAGWNTVASDTLAPESLLESSQLINTTTWNANDALTVKNIASYAILRDRLKTALFGTNFPLGPDVPPFIFSSVEPAPGKWTSDENTITEELRGQGAILDNRLTYQGGGYAELSNPLSYGGNQSPVFASCASAAALNCSDPIGIGATQAVGFPIQVASVNYTVGETRYRDYGVYEQTTYALTEQLKLTEGLRYTWDAESNSSQQTTYHFPVEPPYTQEQTPFVRMRRPPCCPAAINLPRSNPGHRPGSSTWTTSPSMTCWCTANTLAVIGQVVCLQIHRPITALGNLKRSTPTRRVSSRPSRVQCEERLMLRGFTTTFATSSFRSDLMLLRAWPCRRRRASPTWAHLTSMALNSRAPSSL